MRLTYILGLFMLITISHAKLIYLIRNGEELNKKVSNLSTIGEARAKCLVEVFGKNGTFVSPQKIYTKSSGKKNTRPYDTAVPLSEDLQLAIDASFNNDNTGDLTNTILNSPEEIVLIVWTNGDIDDFPHDLGVVEPNWADNVYDEIWILNNNQNVTYTKQTNSTINEVRKYEGKLDYNMIVVKQNVEQCMKNIVPEFAQLNSGSSILKANIITIFVGILLTILFF